MCPCIFIRARTAVIFYEIIHKLTTFCPHFLSKFALSYNVRVLVVMVYACRIGFRDRFAVYSWFVIPFPDRLYALLCIFKIILAVFVSLVPTFILPVLVVKRSIKCCSCCTYAWLIGFALVYTKLSIRHLCRPIDHWTILRLVLFNVIQCVK